MAGICIIWFLRGIALLSLVLIGYQLVSFVLLRKKIDDHPLCRKCKFDLVGHDSIPDQCPECGTYLTTNSDIRIGNSAKKSGLFLCLCVRLTLLLIVGFSSYFFSDRWYYGWVQAYKPNWMLKQDAEQYETERGFFALHEIYIRIRSGSLSPAEINRWVNKAFQIQADFNSPWNILWGVIIQEAYWQGHVSYSDWVKYNHIAIDSGLVFSVLSDPVVKGKEIVYEMMIDIDQYRFGFWGNDPSTLANNLNVNLYMVQDIQFEIDGVVMNPQVLSIKQSLLLDFDKALVILELDQHQWDQIKLGQHILKAKINGNLYWDDRAGNQQIMPLLLTREYPIAITADSQD